MASIKVTYGQTSRKFTIASNTTWKEFESQVHHFFDISNETAISISYIDEDGDVITLSTDSELQQILSDQESFGANVKFNVYTSENPDNNNNGWVLENAEGKDDSVDSLSDVEQTSNKVDEIVAYNIGEPTKTENTETEDTETENTETEQVTNVQTEEEQQSPAVETNYPHVTITEENDDPLFKPTENQQEELLVPADSVNEEKEQPKETVVTEKSSSTSPDENNEESEESENTDSNIVFIISSSPWIQRTYYRPRVNLFDGLLSDYPRHFSHFARPRYSYITPSCGFRRHPYFGSRRFITSGYTGFGGGLYYF